MFLFAFDLIELAGDDRRRDPLEQRQLDLSRLLARAGPGLRLNEWIDGDELDGETVFAHACKLGLEGDRVEAEGLALSLGPLVRLAQVQEPGQRGSEARGRRGLESLGDLVRAGPFHGVGLARLGQLQETLPRYSPYLPREQHAKVTASSG
jgi:hypothetical protein